MLRVSLKPEYRSRHFIGAYGEHQANNLSPTSSLSDFREPSLSSFRESSLSSFREPSLSSFREPSLSSFQESSLSDFRESSRDSRMPYSQSNWHCNDNKSVPCGNTPALAYGATSTLSCQDYDLTRCLQDLQAKGGSSNPPSYSNDDHKSLERSSHQSSLPQLSISPSWIDKFRDVYNDDRRLLKCWFWDNFDWNQHSIWIGKYHCTADLPESDDEIIGLMTKFIDNLDRYSQIKSQIYMKFYFSRNIETNQPEINYLLLCNQTELPSVFLNTTVNQFFEKYQLTEKIVELDADFKKMINHYLNWSNFYIYYSLMEEIQY